MTDEATTAEQPAAEPAPAPIAKAIYGREHEKLVPLEWPVEYDGMTYTEIRVHRVTGKEMRDFMEELRSGDGAVMPPMIDCPQDVWDALDDDDQMAVDEAAAEFMPKRLKILQKAAAALDAAGN